jgi:hypothetical protein
MNAKQELIDFLATVSSRLTCADLTVANGGTMLLPGQKIYLHRWHLQDELQSFLSELDWDYPNGIGSDPDRVFSMGLLMAFTGTLWFEDGSWAIRKGLDDEEWWELQPGTAPMIPNRLTACDTDRLIALETENRAPSSMANRVAELPIEDQMKIAREIATRLKGEG